MVVTIGVAVAGCGFRFLGWRLGRWTVVTMRAIAERLHIRSERALTPPYYSVASEVGSDFSSLPASNSNLAVSSDSCRAKAACN